MIASYKYNYINQNLCAPLNNVVQAWSKSYLSFNSLLALLNITYKILWKMQFVKCSDLSIVAVLMLGFGFVGSLLLCCWCWCCCCLFLGLSPMTITELVSSIIRDYSSFTEKCDLLYLIQIRTAANYCLF